MLTKWARRERRTVQQEAQKAKEQQLAAKRAQMVAENEDRAEQHVAARNARETNEEMKRLARGVHLVS